MKKCSEENCDSIVLARGWCRKHYLRWYRNGDPTMLKDRKKTAARGNLLPQFKHGMWSHPLYPTWHTMMTRCYKSHQKDKTYWGRGITVCERWHDVRNFIADMGEKPSPKHSLDRINNDGNYEPSNCRWADSITQARNRSQARLTDEQRRLILAMCPDNIARRKVATALGLNYSSVKNVVYFHKRSIEKIKGVAK